MLHGINSDGNRLGNLFLILHAMYLNHIIIKKWVWYQKVFFVTLAYPSIEIKYILFFKRKIRREEKINKNKNGFKIDKLFL